MNLEGSTDSRGRVGGAMRAVLAYHAWAGGARFSPALAGLAPS